MRFSTVLSHLVTLSHSMLINATPTSSDIPPPALVERQIPGPQINVYCITHEAKATAADFNTTFDQVCDDLSDHRQLPVGQQIINETCFDDYCITTLLVYKCGSPGSSSSIDFDSCRTLFGLPWNTPITRAQTNTCVSGGYVGSPAPGARWSALSLATPKSATERLPALSSKAWVDASRHLFGNNKRQATDSTMLTLNKEVVSSSPTTNPALRGRKDLGVTCFKETFEDIFDAFCELYELCPFLNDESFNFTQHYDMLDQQVTLSVAHSGACLTGGNTGHETCVAALESALDDVCEEEDHVRGDEGVEKENCWNFSVAID